MTLEDEIRALLAERLAAIVDDFTKLGEERGCERVAKQLDELLYRLPIRGGEVPPGDSPNPRARVLELFNGPPTVGDTANP